METRNKTLNSPPVIEKSPFGSGGFYQMWLYQGYDWLTTPKQGEDPFRIILNNIQKREFWSFHGKLYLILCADTSLSPHQQTSSFGWRSVQRAPLLVALGQDQLLWRSCSPPPHPHYSHGNSPLGHQGAENGCWLTISTKIVAHPFPAAFCPEVSDSPTPSQAGLAATCESCSLVHKPDLFLMLVVTGRKDAGVVGLVPLETSVPGL